MQSLFVTFATCAALTAFTAPAVVNLHADAAPAAARDQRNEQREEQTERLTRTIRIGADGALDVGNIAGDIIVTRGSGADVTLDIVKTARARTASDARDMLALVPVDITERGGRVEVRTRYPQGENRNRRNLNITVSYTITAPATAQVRATSISGNVSVRDIRGEISAESVSGNVVIGNVGRVTAAKTISGNVEINGAEVDGGLDASSVSGNVNVRRIKARRLTLGTVSGNVVLEEVDCGRVNGQTVSGNVEFTGRLSAGGRYEMTSHSGDVRLAIIGDTGFEVDANSFSGSIRSDLPITIHGGDRGRERRQRAVRGVYGDGSAVLDLTTFSGNVVITKR